ncbi:MAG: hypothetical protein AUK60_07835 [Rhodobacteraceae bacterium CG2_30_10_405]|nr:MAG: hypothetical protein AUK60_07835 [Rhodobacteraceae bacterium CG2_30_10_405]
MVAPIFGGQSGRPGDKLQALAIACLQSGLAAQLAGNEEGMMKQTVGVLAGVLALWPTLGLANDGFGGLAATGLTFSQTDAVAMEEEDLAIGIDQIRVAYVFRNVTTRDVTGEVIFPLPPISLAAMTEASWNLPEDLERDNLLAFTATVDGAPVAVAIDRIAVIEPPWDENRPLNQQYDTPGRDVTAALARYGIPLSVSADRVTALLMALSPEQQAEAAAAGLAQYYYPADGGNGVPKYVTPLWSVILRYHWTQTFPAGAVVQIVHEYENRPSGGLFGWQDPPTEDDMLSQVARYCVDAGTSRAMAMATGALDPTAVGDPLGGAWSMGMAWNIEYVLRTANSWAGPIGRFRLTLDKGGKGNVISLCADGIRKTGPTTFVMEKTDFTPSRDLEILVVAPLTQD